MPETGHERRRSPSRSLTLRCLGTSAILYGAYLAGTIQGAEPEQPLSPPHPGEMTAVYDMPFSEQPQNIVGYIDDSFDITCAYRNPAEYEGPLADRHAEYYHVSAADFAGGALTGFVDARRDMAVSGTIDDCPAQQES